MSKLKQILPIFWLLFTYPLFPQANSQIDENNIYAVALTSGLEEMTRQYSHINDGIPGETIRTDYNNMIVKRDDFITSHLPSAHGNCNIEYLDDKQLIERYKKVKLDYPVLVIRPAVVKEARLAVTITVYWVSYKKGMLRFALSDWSITYFRFDCEKRAFIQDKVKLGGI